METNLRYKKYGIGFYFALKKMSTDFNVANLIFILKFSFLVQNNHLNLCMCLGKLQYSFSRFIRLWLSKISYNIDFIKRENKFVIY